MDGKRKLTGRWLAGMMLAVGTMASEAFGQAAAAVPAATQQAMTWQQVLKSGGWPMVVLGAVSVLLGTFVIYFFVILRQSQIAPPALHRVVIESVRGDALDEARKACEYRPCPLASVGLVAVDYARDTPDLNPVLLRDVIEGEGSRQAEGFMGPTQYLLDIAVVAPMIGLLGTVFGMMKAFSALAFDAAKAKPVYLAAGVSQALVTTAFGLLVGIAAMAFYAYFRRQAARMASSLEAAATEIMMALLSRRP